MRSLANALNDESSNSWSVCNTFRPVIACTPRPTYSQRRLVQAVDRRRSLIAPSDVSMMVDGTTSVPTVTDFVVEVCQLRSRNDDAPTPMTQYWPNGTPMFTIG